MDIRALLAWEEIVYNALLSTSQLQLLLYPIDILLLLKSLLVNDQPEFLFQICKLCLQINPKRCHFHNSNLEFDLAQASKMFCNNDSLYSRCRLSCLAVSHVLIALCFTSSCSYYDLWCLWSPTISFKRTNILCILPILFIL